MFHISGTTFLRRSPRKGANTVASYENSCNKVMPERRVWFFWGLLVSLTTSVLQDAVAIQTPYTVLISTASLALQTCSFSGGVSVAAASQPSTLKCGDGVCWRELPSSFKQQRQNFDASFSDGAPPPHEHSNLEKSFHPSMYETGRRRIGAEGPVISRWPPVARNGFQIAKNVAASESLSPIRHTSAQRPYLDKSAQHNVQHTLEGEGASLFGSSPVTLLTSAADFDDFVRREILEQHKIGVILFYGRHCPFCMQFKEVFADAARRAAAAAAAAREGAGWKVRQTGDSVVFAAKEISSMFQEAAAAQNARKSDLQPPPQPVEMRLKVSYIPQLRVIAPLSLAKRPVESASGPHVFPDNMQDMESFSIYGEDEESVESTDTNVRSKPELHRLPGHHGSTGANAATYWVAHVPRTSLSIDGLFSFLSESVHLPEALETSLRNNFDAPRSFNRNSVHSLKDGMRSVRSICESTRMQRKIDAVVSEYHHPSVRPCIGLQRWPESRGAATPATHLYDAVATLVHMLQHWVPTVEGGHSGRFLQSEENVLIRFLELCRYALPGKSMKRDLLKLIVFVHHRGSGAEPTFSQWGLLNSSKFSEVAEEEMAYAASEVWDTDRGHALHNTYSREDVTKRQYKPRPPLDRALWIQTVRDLTIAGIGGETELERGAAPDILGPREPMPRFIHCDTLFCGVWTLMHVLAEGASSVFRRKDKEAQRRKQHEADKARKNDTAKVDEPEQGLQFFGLQDSLGVYAAARYAELLSSSDSGASRDKHKRKYERKSKEARASLGYVVRVLEETFGPLMHSEDAFVKELHRLQQRLVVPAAVVLRTLRDFISSFFTCSECKHHFLESISRNCFGVAQVAAPDVLKRDAFEVYHYKTTTMLGSGRHQRRRRLHESSFEDSSGRVPLPSEVWLPGMYNVARQVSLQREKKNFVYLRLWLWRLHNAVTVRTAIESTRASIAKYANLLLDQQQQHGKTNAADLSPLYERGLGKGYYLNVDPRWPSFDLCPQCRDENEPAAFSVDLTVLAQDKVDVCHGTDFYRDYDATELLRFLSHAYWSSVWTNSSDVVLPSYSH